MFGLVVVLRTGSQTGPPFATTDVCGRRAVSPGYAGAAPPELHHSTGRCSSGDPRLILRTNGPWDSTCPLRAHLRDDGRLNHAFFTCGSNTRAGKIHRRWQEICGAPSAEAFAGFLRALRFQTSALTLADTEPWLRDRCRLAGTRVLRDDWRFPINRCHQPVVTLLASRSAIIVNDH